MLQRVLRGRITFTPKCGGYEFEAPTWFAKLFLGVAVETKREVSYAGTEHIGPEDTFDADYGRLLEAVQNRGKGLASPTGHAAERGCRTSYGDASFRPKRYPLLGGSGTFPATEPFFFIRNASESAFCAALRPPRLLSGISVRM